MGQTEAFYKECFTYLKAKFSNKRPKAVGSEIYTEQPIYNETIVALEQIHNVLTKIENGSAYTREDYEDSVIKKEVDKTKEIIDFFKVLGLSSSDEMASAFDNFHKYYYWDSKIYRYKKFLHSSEEMKDWDRTELKMWSLEKFDATKFFDFLDRYKNFVDSSLVLSDEEGQKSDLINERIVEQNANYERLLSSYNNLLDQKVKFGVSVFDVNLPSSLNDLSDPDVRFFSSKFVAEFARYMDREFSGDDGVLLVINHAHVVSYNTFALSYLVIYKKKNYDSPEKLVEHYLKRTYTFAGTRKAEHIKVIDRGQMIKKIYPLDHFIGELKGEKQKIDFREKFLRYFLSSVFLLDVDKGTFLEEYENYYSIFFNHFRYFKEKIYKENLNAIIGNKLLTTLDLEIILEEKSYISGLKKVGDVRGKTGLINFQTGNTGDKKAEKKLKMSAAAIGCPFVLMTSDKTTVGSNSNALGGTQAIKTGIAYKY